MSCAGARRPVALSGFTAALFDLDGTLADTVPDLAAAVNRALVSIGRSPVSADAVRGWVGNGVAPLVRRALTDTQNGAPSAAQVELALDRFFGYYAERLCVATRAYPGARQALAALAAAGVRLACVTNKPVRFTTPLLDALDMRRYFAVIVAGDTLARNKPDPAPLLFACEQLGVEPSAAIMVGDSVSDVGAARAAGMPVVCVSYGYNQGCDLASLAPDAVVDSLVEIERRPIC